MMKICLAASVSGWMGKCPMICGSISAHEEFEESFRPCSKEGRRAGGRGGGRSDLEDILALLLEEGFGSFPGEERLRFLGGNSIEKFWLEFRLEKRIEILF